MTIQELSNQLADSIASLAPSVVGVSGRKRRGSGLVLDENTVVSALHVVRWSDSATIHLDDGSERSAEVVGRDVGTDLVVLRVEDGGLSAPPIGDANTLRVGNLVLVLGRPGESVRATLGIVSAKGGGWRSRYGLEIEPYLEVDASLPRGFGGGPLVDTNGAVVGLNTPLLTRGGATLPIATVLAVVEAASRDGMRRGYLGVAFQAVDLPQPLAEARGQARGLLVSSVAPGSPAANAGVEVSDILLELNSVRLESHSALVGALGRSVEKSVELSYARGGEHKTLTVSVAERQQSGRRRHHRRRRGNGGNGCD